MLFWIFTESWSFSRFHIFPVIPLSCRFSHTFELKVRIRVTPSYTESEVEEKVIRFSYWGLCVLLSGYGWVGSREVIVYNFMCYARNVFSIVSSQSYLLSTRFKRFITTHSIARQYGGCARGTPSSVDSMPGYPAREVHRSRRFRQFFHSDSLVFASRLTVIFKNNKKGQKIHLDSLILDNVGRSICRGNQDKFLKCKLIPSN